MAQMSKLLSITAAVAFAATGAQAASLQNTTGLEAPTSIETFDGTAFGEFTPAGTLFNGFTFSANLLVTTMAEGIAPSLTGQSIANFSDDAPLGEIRFDHAVRGAAFSMLMFPGDAQFSAYLGQNLVETASYHVNYDGLYVGFSGITFDRIVFGSQTNMTGMAIDNLQTAAVPEPQTYALFAAGLLAMGVLSRRRSPRH